MEPIPEQRKLKDIIKDLGESSSLHGIPKIISSRQIAVKVLWFLLLVGTSGVFGYQMYGLFNQYYSYPVKTSMSLQFAVMRLPAVTLCNMNPVKQNAAFSKEHARLLNDTTLTGNETDSEKYNPSDMSGDMSGEIPEDLIEEDIYYTLSTSRDEYIRWKQTVLGTIKNQKLEQRIEYGHQRDELILKSTFGGFALKRDNCITHLQTTNYGNCYTIDSPGFVAHTSGPDDGHELILFLNIDEYVDTLTTGYGVRIVIHEAGTLPMPDVEGLTLNPGFETNIGIKMTHLERLGGLYGDCNDGVDFYKETGVQYSTKLCQARCRVELVMKECACIPLDAPDFFNYTHTYDFCFEFEYARCMNDVTARIGNSKLCDCARKCSEHAYTTTMSSRAWLSAYYLQNVFLNESCTTLNSANVSWTACDPNQLEASLNALSNNSVVKNITKYNEYSNNFMKVNIYYEDLNFAQVIEEPLYDLLRFLSDIGGAMGLYMGASLLTYVEILQLLLECVIHFQKKISLRKQHSTVNVTTLKVNSKGQDT